MKNLIRLMLDRVFGSLFVVHYRRLTLCPCHNRHRTLHLCAPYFCTYIFVNIIWCLFFGTAKFIRLAQNNPKIYENYIQGVDFFWLDFFYEIYPFIILQSIFDEHSTANACYSLNNLSINMIFARR